jgi:hypothetical protein
MGVAMSSKEFKEWLEKNRKHLLKYNAWEVANLALACGFHMKDIGPDTSEWITSSYRKLKLWESPFYERWLDHALREKGRDE